MQIGYKTKFGLDGKVDRHKARLVAKKISQVEGIDYTETFSPVAKMNSIYLFLSLVASFKWEFHQMEIYMKKSTWNNPLALIPCSNIKGKFLRSRTKGHRSQTDHK